MLLEREALARCKAKTELHLRRRGQPAIGEIAARFCAGAAGKRRLEEFRREVHDVVEALGPRIALLLLGRDFRQCDAGHLREAFDRFGKGDAFGQHDEIENRAVLAGGEIEPGFLLVIDEEGRRFLFVERRQALELAARADELDALADDFRDRQPGFQFIQELRREAHRRRIGLGSGAVRRAVRAVFANRMTHHRPASRARLRLSAGGRAEPGIWGVFPAIHRAKNWLTADPYDCIYNLRLRCG